MAMANCMLCGKLFNRARDRVCPACVEAEKAEFDMVVEYIRENNVRFIPQLAEETEVDRKKILKWVREGKLNLETEQKTTTDGCHRCGVPTHGTGDLCDKCRKKLAQDIAVQRAEMEPAASKAEAPPRGGQGMYHLDH